MSVLRIVALCLLLSAATADDGKWISARGLFVVTYQSDLEPLRINTLHAWTVHVETASGEAVPGASIAVSGGMPLHNHGLPTAPRVTAELGGGDYRLEGMRFHMAGPWEVTLLISSDEQTDSVLITLTL